jgi:hypothetical protein
MEVMFSVIWIGFCIEQAVSGLIHWCCLYELDRSLLLLGTRRHTRRLSSQILLSGLAHFLASLGKHLVKVILEPSDIRAQASEFPHAIDLLVPVGVGAVGVSLDGDRSHGLISVLLVRHSQLVVADDFVVGDLLELGAAAEVLGLELLVAQDFGVGGHGDVFVRRHLGPELVEEGAVVDAHGRGHNFAETLPVLGKS